MAEISALDALLGASVDVEEKVYIKRLKTNFTVKALTGDKLNELREQCTYTEGKGANRRTFTNEDELGKLLIAEACIEPDFSDAKLLAKYGAKDAADCVQKALLAGEVTTLSHAVLDVSGFDNAAEDVETAKN
ncbi:phage tail assembly chaperone [Sporosarcina sp. SAFN-015]|uniref:phage tail assembly chaperone n=1 Tax=Sporosarcina sp. SAFN-015 TaxID=3387274 RepID=UPI003F7F299B